MNFIDFRSKRMGDYGIVLYFMAAPLLFYFNFWYESDFWAPHDCAYTGIPGFQLWKTKLQEGFSSMLWNQYVESGYPFLPDIQNGVYYPFRFLLFLLPYNTAYNYLILLHFSMGGWFSYLFLRSLGCSRSASLLGGTAFMFAPTTNLRIAHCSVFFTIIWVPLVLYFLEKTITKNQKYLVLAALAFLLQLFACFFQVVIYSGILYVSYILFRYLSESNNFKTGCKQAAVSIFFFGILWGLPAMLCVLPTYELTKFVGRDEMTFAFFTYMSLHPLALFWYINPQCLGDLTPFSETGLHEFGSVYTMFETTTHEHQIYVGSLTFFVAVFSLRFFRNDKQFAFWWSVWLVCTLIALGKYVPPLAQLIYQIPVIGSCRVPGRILFITTYALIFLFALTVDRISKQTDNRIEWQRLVKFLTVSSIISVLVLLGTFLVANSAKASWASGVTVAQNKALTAWMTAYYHHFDLTNLCLYASPVLLIVSTVILKWMFSRLGIISKSKIAVVLGVLLVADLWVYVFPINSKWFRNVPTSDLVEFLQKNETATDRHYFMNAAVAPFYTGQEREMGVVPWLNIYHHLPSIVGYETFAKPNYFEGMARLSIIPNLDQYLVDNRLFSSLGVKHVILPNSQEITNFMRQHCADNYKTVQLYKNYNVYENVRYKKRFHGATKIRSIYDNTTENSYLPDEGTVLINAFPDSFPAEVASVSIVDFDYKPANATAYTDTAEQSFLVFAENYYPGWSVTIDRHPVRLDNVNGIMMGVFVPPGKHTVTFRYFPTTLKIGLISFFIGILLSLFLYIYWDRKNKTIRAAHISERNTFQQ